LQATLDNDANCATFGEWWLGAARGAKNVVGMTIGTGIGGGLILDGRLYHGSSDVAGEIGHTTIDVTGRRCKCGNYGCLEAYASGPSIAERAREAAVGENDSLLYQLVDGDLTKLTAATVYEAAQRGDDVARDVVAEAEAAIEKAAI
jgi:glucokinase